MNWYFRTKFAQLDVYYDEDDFADVVKALYELEYKWSMLKQRPFNGHPRRYENILQSVQNNLVEAAELAKDMLIKVYEEWLSGHAITDPLEWGEARTRDIVDMGDFEYVLEGLIAEYVQYSNPNAAMSFGYNRDNNVFELFKKGFFQALNQENLPKNLQAIKNGIIYGYREYMVETFLDNPREFNNMYGTEFEIEDQDEAEEYISKLDIGHIYDAEYFYFDTIQEFQDAIDRLNAYTPYYVDLKGLASEMYTSMVFPVWFAKWQGEGIEATRESVEDTYKLLLSASPEDLGDMSAKVNLAVNQAHQTGEMSTYIENTYDSNDIQAVLSELTQGIYVENWNEELREIGVQI